jgi:uncharacterized HhH-GPD family protein
MAMPTPDTLPFTEDEAANRLLASNPTALLVGMLLDQQFPMERAFLSPHLLAERLGGDLDPESVTEIDEAALEELFRGPPALHRYPASMAKRTRALCAHISDEYGGDAAAIWTTASDGDELYRRLKALPGFGESKARIFVAVVGRRLGAGPPGWEERAADWPSIADVDSFDEVYVLREQKRAMKQAKRAP